MELETHQISLFLSYVNKVKGLLKLSIQTEMWKQKLNLWKMCFIFGYMRLRAINTIYGSYRLFYGPNLKIEVQSPTTIRINIRTKRSGVEAGKRFNGWGCFGTRFFLERCCLNNLDRFERILHLKLHVSTYVSVSSRTLFMYL